MRSITPTTFLAIFTTLLTLLITFGPVAPVAANPVSVSKRATSSYWVANIARNGTSAFLNDDTYAVYRNVKDYGATGNGNTDDTASINAAITAGTRCGQGCDSTTIKPAIIYFPPGTYKISKPIVQLYYTQFIGDAITPPTITADSSFVGIALIDSDPYESDGSNWYTNQNNFFRQIRNFVINLKPMGKTGTGIHWQVAQATSLQNIVFNMYEGTDSTQQGIFMDNGSGGFMSDLIFNGGNYGAFLGNQQFTSRNWTFNNCNTAIFMNWNWAWTLKSVTINNCAVGLDISNGGPTAQTVGSVILMDSKISNTPIAIKTSFSTAGSTPNTGGTLVVDNVDFSTNVPVAIQSYSGSTLLKGNQKIALWREGREYTGAKGSRVQDKATAPSKPAALLSSSGYFYERSRPQYESYPASSFVSVKKYGAKGDGSTDDTAAVQAAMVAVGKDTTKILYFDHGAYVVTKTIQVPANIKITGEIWPLIMAKGSFFSSETSPQPVFNVGTAGQSGAVEITDLIFETMGAAPGAIMIKWNLNSVAGASGMWDTHVRIGGSAGTQLQSDKCLKNPSVQTNGNTGCEGAFLLFWATPKSGGVYLENTWFWVADHELDRTDHGQIDIYNGRGVLIESQGGPAWLYGTSSEHSIFYNYQVNNAKNVFMGMIQTETPYFQANPKAPKPLTIGNYNWGSSSDPNWAYCESQPSLSNSTCYKSWGLRVMDSTNVFLHGAGLYSFFENYDQTCVANNDCQRNILGIKGDNTNLNMYAINTKASYNIVTYDGVGQALDLDNRNNFCGTLARWILPTSSATTSQNDADTSTETC